jgi:hypothetical protein
MNRPVVLLARAESLLAASVAELLTANNFPTLILDIDAPVNGEPVTVRDDHVRWQGHDLGAAAALWIEDPIFPWPQMIPSPCPLPDVANFERWRHYQREARALAVAALAAAGATAPVLNPVGSAHLAVSLTAALDHLAAAAVPVHPWRVTGGAIAPDELAVDAVGSDRWHRPAAVPAGSARLCFAPVPGTVTELLLIGGDVAATRRWAQAADWAWCPARTEPTVATEAAAPLAELGRRCAAALELEILQVACVENATGPAVLRADAAPDLAAWDAQAAGAVAAALARRLAALAASR